MNPTPLRRLSAIGAAAALAAVGLAHPLAAQADTQQYLCSDNTVPITPESGLTPNEAVTAKTVVSGTTPTTFSGTYIGSIKNGVAIGKDMLLVRLTGSPIDGGANGDVRSGIWEGMSGSPVYDASGNLIGAIAYGLTTSSTNIAGVTPIADMKAIGADTAEAAVHKSVTVTRSNATTAASVALAGRKLTELKAVPVVTGSAPGGKITLKGTSAARASAFLSEADSATTASQSDETYPIAAGGNLFVGYSSGDVTIGGLGTVTAVCGNTVWGFGHPMDQAGQTQLSIAGADAATIIPDDTGTTISFKQASVIGAPVGTITQDRLSGVKGTLGTLPTNGVPVTSTFTTAAGSTTLSTTVYGQDHLDVLGLEQVQGHGVAALDTVQGHGSIRVSIDYKTATGQTGTIRVPQFESTQYLFQELIGLDAMNDFDDLAGAPVGVTVTAVRIAANVGEGQLTRTLTGVQVKTGGKWKTMSKVTASRGARLTVRGVVSAGKGTSGTVYTPATTITLPINVLGPFEVDLTGGQENATTMCFDGGCLSLNEGVSATTWPGFVRAMQNQNVNSAVYTTSDYMTFDANEVSKNYKPHFFDAAVSGQASLMVHLSSR